MRIPTLVVICTISFVGCVNTGPGPEQTYVLKGVSTPEACLESDARCLQNKFDIACSDRSSSTIATCTGWLEALESLPEPTHIEVKLARGYTYYRFFDLSRFRILLDQTRMLDEFANYRQEAREAYQLAFKSDRNNTQAMTGLATTSDSDEERLKWIRRIVSVGPSSFSCRSLTNSLSRVYGHSEREKWLDEVAACYLAIYTDMEPSLEKWRAGMGAVGIYRETNHNYQAERLLRRVTRDISPGRRIRELQTIGNLTHDEVLFSLQTLCTGVIREELGVERCISGITTALFALSDVTPEQTVSYADLVMEGIIERLRPVDIVVDIADIESTMSDRADLISLIEQTLISRGIESGKIYSTYSYLLSENFDKSLAAQLKAVELEPEDGDIRQRLADLYASRGMTELAIEQYELALLYGPEYKHSSLRLAISRLKELSENND